MPIEVFVANEQSARPVDCARWATLAEAALGAEGIRGDAELSVLFVDEESIASLNERFLGHEGPTDVLSFPIEDAPAPGGHPPSGGPTRPDDDGEDTGAPLLLGDVVICPAVAWRNAPQHAGTYEDELALLLVHGILHLLGRDHVRDDEAEEMEARERELLAAFHRKASDGDVAGLAGAP